MGSIIEDGFKSLKNVTIDEKTMRKIASEVKQEYKSTYNAKELADNLTKVFAYLKDTKNVSYEDMVRIVQEIATPVIEESTDVDSVEADVYNSFRNTLKAQKIRLNEAQKKEKAISYNFLTYDRICGNRQMRKSRNWVGFSLDIPEEMYRNNPSEAEEQILAKALQITQNRKIE